MSCLGLFPIIIGRGLKYILDGRSKKAHIMLLSRGSVGILNKKESVEKFL